MAKNFRPSKGLAEKTMKEPAINRAHATRMHCFVHSSTKAKHVRKLGKTEKLVNIEHIIRLTVVADVLPKRIHAGR
jgi:hypothetical protein